MTILPFIQPKNESWFFHKKPNDLIAPSNASHAINGDNDAVSFISNYYIYITGDTVTSNYPHLQQADKSQAINHDMASAYCDDTMTYICDIQAHETCDIHIIIAPYTPDKWTDVSAILHINVHEHACLNMLITHIDSPYDIRMLSYITMHIHDDGQVNMMRHSTLKQHNANNHAMTRQYHIVEANIGHQASLRHYIMAAQGAFNRHETHVNLNQAKAHYHAASLTHATSGTHDMMYNIQHHVGDTYSAMHNRALLDGTAHGIFMAKTRIDEHATNSETHQQSKGFLLSDNAKMDTKPELDIRHDQVIATHGSAIGELDDMQLFYCEQRGIDPAFATTLLAHGLLAEILTDNAPAQYDNPLYKAWLQAINLQHIVSENHV